MRSGRRILFCRGSDCHAEQHPGKRRHPHHCLFQAGSAGASGRQLLPFGDRPGLRRIIGICLVLVSLWLLRDEERSDENPDSAGSGSLMLLLLTLLFFGAGDSISKVFENIGSRQQDSLLFFYLFVTAAVLTAILAFFEYRKTGKRILLREMTAGIAVGIPNYFASSFLLQAVVRLPAFFVYPANSTGTILLVMAVSALAFGERPGKRQWAGIICILVALLCLS